MGLPPTTMREFTDQWSTRSFLGDLAIKYLFIIKLNESVSGVQMFSIDSISCDCFDCVVT